MPNASSVVIVGAGPAGLTAAAELAEKGVRATVLEKDPRYVGGISRTVRYKDFRFDVGGHRFFSKNPEITRWWRDLLPAGAFLKVKRLSRIFYRGRYFDYPLRAGNAFLGLGPWTCLACLLSYARARLFPVRPEVSFADWVSNRFGRKLFTVFFKTYTEKVWGMPCEQISADWAAQRIKGLSLGKAMAAALRPGRGTPRGAGQPTIKTLIDEFEYPRLGPGMMWEQTARDIREQGGEVHQGWEVVRINRRESSGKVMAVVARNPQGDERSWPTDHLIVSMPLRDCVAAFDPPLGRAAREAAARLSYRDFLTVALIVERAAVFPDNWIYVHDPGVRMGRIQNFNNWSRDMVPGEGKTCLGLEYFCFEGDDLWAAPDAELIALGKRELARLGLVEPREVSDGCVVRMEKAYPVYGPGYQRDVAVIRAELEKVPNLQVVGRNGMHKYNNQDHSMLTALLAARNLLGAAPHDLWKVNADAEYHEEHREGTGGGGRLVPTPVAEPIGV